MIHSIIAKQIALCGHKAPSADNSQPWHFSWDGSSLLIKYDTTRVENKTFPASSPATLLSLGTAIENISLVSNDYNIANDLSIDFQNLSATHVEAVIELKATDQLTFLDLPNSHPVINRHTNRFSFLKKPLPKTTKNHLRAINKDSARLLIIEEQNQVNQIGDLVKLASNIRFQTKEVHEWLGKSLRFSEEDVKKADGLDVRTLDLPPGGSAFLKFISSWNRMKLLNQIGAYRLLAKIDAAPIKAAPALLAIIAPSTPQGALHAGMLMCNAWTYLNKEDIAVHPYYVVADQLARLRENSVPEQLISNAQDIEKRCQKVLDIKEGETLHMLLRVGYPKRAPTRSLRLPEELVFTDISNESP